jgi:hypothetical protein
MKNGVLDLDHLMIHVRDSERAGATFARMGFAPTPRSVLPGMSNRLICFDSGLSDRNNFLELMALDDRAKAPPVMSDILGEGERPASMVMVSRDARAAERELAASGFEPLPAMHFKRDWVLPSGEVLSPEFVVCIPKVGRSPLYWNLCQYLNPELYKRADFLRHRNGAERLVAVVAVARDPEATAAHFAAAWGAPLGRSGDGAIEVKPGNVALRAMSVETLARRYPDAGVTKDAAACLVGAVIRVRDVGRVRQCLADGKFGYGTAADGALYVAPAEAHGVLVVFEQA